MTLTGYTVEMVVVGLKGGCELVALFPAAIDGSRDAKACKEFNCPIDTYLVYCWKCAAQCSDAYGF